MCLAQTDYKLWKNFYNTPTKTKSKTSFFSIFSLFYLRILELNWRWALILYGKKLKSGSVIVLATWSWLVILPAWWHDFVSERFLVRKLHIYHVTEVIYGFLIYGYAIDGFLLLSFLTGPRFNFVPYIEHYGCGVHFFHPLQTIYLTRASCTEGQWTQMVRNDSILFSLVYIMY